MYRHEERRREAAALARLGHRLSRDERGAADAERLLRSAVSLAPDLPFARYALGAHLAREGRSREAQPELLAAARRGLPAAQNALACLYLRADAGRGADRARPWLERAARAGDPEALFNLAVLHDFGDGVPRDPRRAAELYARAAALDLPAAQYNLAVLLREGDGVPRDERQAAHWLARAAALGDAGAQFAFACACRDGVGTPRDPERARTWFERAARRGHARARYVLALELLLGARAAHGEASPALRWLACAARDGEPEAQNALGLAYFHGRGVPRDPRRAFWWFSRAAHAGHEAAQVCLGMAYLLGNGPAREPGRGVRWLERAADTGHPGAQRRLAACLAIGLGGPADPTRAYMWALLACEGGDSRAWQLRRLVARRLTPRQRVDARRLADAWIGTHPPGARPSARRAATCGEPFESPPGSGLGPRRRAPSSLGIGAPRG